MFPVGNHQLSALGPELAGWHLPVGPTKPLVLVWWLRNGSGGQWARLAPLTSSQYSTQTTGAPRRSMKRDPQQHLTGSLANTTRAPYRLAQLGSIRAQ